MRYVHVLSHDVDTEVVSQRHLLIVVTVGTDDSRAIRAYVSWDEVQRPLRTTSSATATMVFGPVGPEVQILSAGHTFTMPIYIRISSLPGVTLPVSEAYSSVLYMS